MPFFSTLSEEYGAVLTISMDWEWNKRFYTLCCHNVSRIVNNLWVLYSFLFLCSTKPRSLLSQLSTVLLFYIKIKVLSLLLCWNLKPYSINITTSIDTQEQTHIHTHIDINIHTYKYVILHTHQYNYSYAYIEIHEYTETQFTHIHRVHLHTGKIII